MRVVSGKIADENICLHNKVQTNLKKLVKELPKIKNKVKNISKSISDLSKLDQTGPSSEAQTPIDKCNTSKGRGTGTTSPIPRKRDIPLKKPGMIPCATRTV
jgi:hypothetical protein